MFFEKFVKPSGLPLPTYLMYAPLESKILDASTFIKINQYNTDKLNLDEKIGDVDKKYMALVV